MNKIAIMQPTFMPWMGYLAMFPAVDRFVFLDSVQFAKRSWQQRNQIKTAQGQQWLTIPVKSKGQRDQLILDAEIEIESKPHSKILSTIRMNYSKAPYFKQYFEEFENVFLSEPTSLCELNIKIIHWFLDKIELKKPEIVRASSLSFEGAKADLIANICEHFKADIYLSAPGSKEYNDASSAFSARNIKVVYHNYKHPNYKQLYGDFLPYMSAIDLLLNEGPQAKDLVVQGLQGIRW